MILRYIYRAKVMKKNFISLVLTYYPEATVLIVSAPASYDNAMAYENSIISTAIVIDQKLRTKLGSWWLRCAPAGFPSD